MLAAGAVMIVGVTAVALVSQVSGLRVGGVMVIPLVAVYSLYEPWTPIVFFTAWVAAFAALWIVRRFTLQYGRRPFLVAVAVGAVTSILAVAAVDTYTASSLSFREAEIVGSIFPGIAAYNVMRLDPQRRPLDLAVGLSTYVALIAVGLGLLLVTARFQPHLPAVLYASDVPAVHWLGIEAPRSRFPRAVSQEVVVALVLADVTVYETIRARYDVPLSGIILVPLLAVFSARVGVAFLLYTLLATATFLLVTVVHWSTLLYGRNLLAFALVVGTAFGLVLGALTPTAPGVLVFFVGLLAGVGAYNLHRTSPSARPANVLLSAALFVLLYGVLWFIVDPGPAGLASPLRWYHVAIGAVTLVLAGRELVRLEREKPDPAAFTRASLFGGDDRL